MPVAPAALKAYSGMGKQSGIKIAAVAAGGLAEAVGLVPGDILLRVNGEAVLDCLNYQFLVAQRDATEVLVQKADGSRLLAEIENGGDGLGLGLKEDEVRVCRQSCIFCFVRQMPPGFRKSLYVKDEDIRLSFLRGHFTTLSNSDGAELDRIIRERLSPLHISVHATRPKARAALMGSPKAGGILGKLDRLIGGGIEMHAQAVVLPGVNDGAVWEATLSDLWRRRARAGGTRGGILSLSCVPVGLTAHRQNLPKIQEIDLGYAERWAKKWGAEARRYAIGGEPWLMLADEWYAKAGMKMPGRRSYSASWVQIENGVGLVRRFLDHSRRFTASGRALGFAGLRLLLLTGRSFAPYLESAACELNRRVGSHISVAAAANRAFGESVTVAGLLCGRDLLESAKACLAAGGPYDAVALPSAAVRPMAGGHEFLDGATLADIQSELGLPVALGGDNFSRLLSEIKTKLG
jgi:putative radical SAM enzyme (TIGR03279 family)